VKVFYEFGLRQMNKKKEELCGDSVEFLPGSTSATLVFSDGMGSGVKASILSTLTTRIASRMLDEGLPLDEVVQTISAALPICRVRKIAYSTFALGRLFTEGHAKLAAFDSPPPFVIRRGKMQQLPYEDHEVAGKTVHDFAFALRPGDWLILVSDGVVNAGIGGAYPLGWGWENVAAYLEGHVHESLSAEDLAAKLARVVEDLYEGPPGDDVSIAVIKVRHKRVLVMFTGPPVKKEDDERVVDELMSARGKRVVCGGTSAIDDQPRAGDNTRRRAGRRAEMESGRGQPPGDAAARGGRSQSPRRRGHESRPSEPQSPPAARAEDPGRPGPGHRAAAPR